MNELSLLTASGSSAEKLYSDSVFSAYTYTGNGSTQTINNGIDLAGEGGLVWTKKRTGTSNNQHHLHDTARGATNALQSDSTDATLVLGTGLTSFSASGFSLGSHLRLNESAVPYASWTFRKAAKFFDVVTYTGNGVAGRQIPHALGIAPGMMIVKCTSTSATNWCIYHKASALNFMFNVNAGANSLQHYFGNSTVAISPTSEVFTISGEAVGNDVNATGLTYVAYLFAHDSSADGIVQCGSFTTDGSGNATVNLGWEPQFSIIKSSSSALDWYSLDTTRGWVNGSTDAHLYPNASVAEANANRGHPTATGFDFTGGASVTYIYLAIRRPNKPPTTGTQVYGAATYTGDYDKEVITTGYPPISDLILMKPRSSATYNDWIAQAALTRTYLKTTTTDAEGSSVIDVYGSTGFTIGNSARVNQSGISYVTHFFKRAQGVFEICCYTGTGSATTVAHSLGVAPELIITKKRSATSDWRTLFTPVPTLLTGVNASNGGLFDDGSLGGYFGDGTTYVGMAPTANVFRVGIAYDVNQSAHTYVAYLFATKAGINKVGSYTGNGSSQTIDCGFTTGARFILIKRTDGAGDWCVWDSTRGIVAGNDPHLSLNTTAAEVTTDDSIDPDSTGFIVNQLAATNINVNTASYIYLAFA